MNTTAIKQIQFPILRKIQVDGYLLYPGTEQKTGLEYSFLSGVNVVVGINGIGKTTLLLMLYRMLVGDQDLREGEDEIGGVKRQLKRSEANLFSVRVPDRAADATATLTFTLGTSEFSITRSLKTLALSNIEVSTIDGSSSPRLEDLESTYKSCITLYSGVDDFYDWVLILRYLVFYLEDRRSLVWDVWAQTEVFRILFLQEATNDNYKTLLNLALSADSTARNTQAVLTRERSKLDKLKFEATKDGPENMPLLRAKVKGQLAQSEQLASQLIELDKERRDCRDQAARLRNSAEVLSQQERELRERMLSQMFPKLSDYGAFVTVSIDSLHGCVVCGTQDTEHLLAAKKKLHDALHCPLCGADPDKQEERPGEGNTSRMKQELDEIAESVTRARRDAELASIAEKKAEQLYLETQSARLIADSESRVSRERLAHAEQLAGVGSNDSIRQFESRLQAFQDTIDDANEEKNLALHKLGALVTAISTRVAGFKGQLIASFEQNIKHFLAESCQLTYRTASRRIGQNVSPIPLLFPEFHVAMTSGVFRETGTPRDEAWSVSESQKEFIELAFRMALLSGVAEVSGFSLVIETPEANLDAVFIPRAGEALNSFAPRKSSRLSNVIASSNLNGSLMIRSLLGLKSTAESSGTTSTDTRARVLNLLDFAAKGAALREYEDAYKRELNAAIGLPN